MKVTHPQNLIGCLICLVLTTQQGVNGIRVGDLRCGIAVTRSAGGGCGVVQVRRCTGIGDHFDYFQRGEGNDVF